MEAIVVHDFYFVQKRNAIGLLGLSSIHKCTSTIKMLAYDVAIDYTDKYCRLNESIALECLKRFVKTNRTCFESNYLKQPTLVDVKKQMKINKKRRFLGMFASIDCMH
jgi:aminoglycoside/choline kinase family phosphotransferase